MNKADLGTNVKSMLATIWNTDVANVKFNQAIPDATEKASISGITGMVKGKARARVLLPVPWGYAAYDIGYFVELDASGNEIEGTYDLDPTVKDTNWIQEQALMRGWTAA